MFTGQLPKLELFTTLQRTVELENEAIIYETLDGMAMVAAALFESTGPETSAVTFRLGYYLPENLKEFVGTVPVYGHVQEILQGNMATMKVRTRLGCVVVGGGEEILPHELLNGFQKR